MSSRTLRVADSKSARGSTHPGQKRPAMLSINEPTKQTGDSPPLLVSLPPVRLRALTMPCPMSPMTPDLDIDDGSESSGSSQSNSTATFTFNLLSPTTPQHGRGLSFTACPTSPLDESEVYAFPPRKHPTSAGFPLRSRRHSADHSDLPVVFDSPLLSEDPLKEGAQSPSDDRKHFHIQFLQEDYPFPKTPDC